MQSCSSSVNYTYSDNKCGQHKPTNALNLRVFWGLNIWFVYHDNHKLNHITIMDLCDTIITPSKLLHITILMPLIQCN